MSNKQRARDKRQGTTTFNKKRDQDVCFLISVRDDIRKRLNQDNTHVPSAINAPQKQSAHNGSVPMWYAFLQEEQEKYFIHKHFDLHNNILRCGFIEQALQFVGVKIMYIQSQVDTSE